MCEQVLMYPTAVKYAPSVISLEQNAHDIIEICVPEDAQLNSARQQGSRVLQYLFYSKLIQTPLGSGTFHVRFAGGFLYDAYCIALNDNHRVVLHWAK